jgi:folate-binding protein YgfZ
MTQITFTAGVLPNRAVITVEGEDSRTFLQSILSCDVSQLQEDQAAYGALLTPQGKILFDVFVQDRRDGIFYVDCAASQINDLVKRLSLYKLRAKVRINHDQLLRVTVWPFEPGNGLEAFVDPRSSLMGWRAYMPGGSKSNAHEDAQAEGYDAARIALGLADTDADLGSGEFFPHEANLDQFGGVSFTKGCYVGQEVVSRTEHRGTARSRILPIALDGPAPARGSDIRADGLSIGTVLGGLGQRALALIRLDRLAEATAPLLTEGVRVRVLKPPFARYDVPGAKDDA